MAKPELWLGPGVSPFPILAMNQYLLIPFLLGWTSIYQLFWGSLGTRVLTHPHFGSKFETTQLYLSDLSPLPLAKLCVFWPCHEGSYCDHLAMQKSARFTGTDCIPWNSLLNFIGNQPCCLMTLWNTFRVLTCFINFGRAANMKVNLVVYVHYILQLQDEKIFETTNKNGCCE